MDRKSVIAASLLAHLGFVQLALAEPAGNLTGIWRTAGYNFVLEVAAEDYAIYEITSISAVKVREGKVASIGEELGQLRQGASADEFVLSPKYSVAPIKLGRIDQLPRVRLVKPADADPVTQFDILWHTFQENYAFFVLRGVDWSAEYEKWRPQVSSDTSEAELFRICASMVSTLGDNHVLIDAEGFDYAPYRRPPDLPLVHHWRKAFELQQSDMPFIKYVRGKYEEYKVAKRRELAGQLMGKLSLGANDQLAWGILPGGVGYLEIRAMGGYAQNDEDAQVQFAALTETLDRALAEMADVRGMIVDVRFNGGGWDDASLLIASRFADRRRVAFSKQARAERGFTPRYVVYVEPAGPRQFTRPVILLTSRLTASAAEIFTYCMTALPHVTQAGGPTMGIHSDMLERHLPGGWTFYLSNEVYRSGTGAVYEKTGIAPTHQLETFTPADVKHDRNQVIGRAVQLIDSQ